MSVTENIKTLLHNTQSIVKHQEEIKNLRGESFNIFSILKMESKENTTHSAFLGELLNPDGSHLLKRIFLLHFLNTIHYPCKLQVSSATVHLEKHIGSRNDNEYSGGRVDIYIEDAKGNCICIENKIYAYDQNAQLARYCNHKKGSNTVYYLTLNGDTPSDESRVTLKEGEDFHCISYKSTLIEWLQLCLKEAAEHPIVRETIRQYIILIKKLTNQLTDSKMEKELQEHIKNNYNASKIIEGSVWKMELQYAVLFLEEVKSKIELELGNGWSVSVDSDISKSWSGLEITHQDWNGILVKLEGYPKVPWSKSGFGVRAHKDDYDRSLLKNKLSNVPQLKEGFTEYPHWPFYKEMFSLASNEERERLFDDVKRKDLVNSISDQLISLAKACQIPLSNIKRIQVA